MWSAVALSFFWFHRHGNERFIKNTDIEYFVWTFVMFDFGQVRVKSNRDIVRKCFNIGKKKTLWSEQCYERNDTKYIRKAYFYWIQVLSSPCLVSPWVTCWILFKLLELSKLIHGFLHFFALKARLFWLRVPFSFLNVQRGGVHWFRKYIPKITIFFLVATLCQSTQCLGSVVPLAMFILNILWHVSQSEYGCAHHRHAKNVWISTNVNSAYKKN